jgi:hypothetical protein
MPSGKVFLSAAHTTADIDATVAAMVTATRRLQTT